MTAESQPLAFSADFRYGFATAAYQIEGDVNEGGRLPSVWDEFCDSPGKIIDGTSGVRATESYHRFEEDIKLLKQYGANAYRFSFSWSRITLGAGSSVNPEGVAYYNKVIDALLAAGIEPCVTLFHWDFPLELYQKYDGWLNKEQSVRDFVHYATVCFEAFGDRVKTWITINEPFCVSILGHSIGVHAPGRTSDRSKSPVGDSSTEPWIVGHSLLIAHGAVARVYREKFANKASGGSGQIAISLNGDWCEPWSPEDKEAAQRAQEFWVGWFGDPLYLTGDYPACMRKQLGDRLPTFSEEEKKLVLHSSDFYGMNHYSANLIKDKKGPAALDDFQGNVEYTTVGPNGIPPQLGPISECASWLQDVPWGFSNLLRWIYKRYGKPIVVTENGFCVKGEGHLPVEKAIKDDGRVHYYSGYLDEMEKAMKDGVDVRGYMAWSLLDNFEWAEGYGPRFGVTYVDYETQKRTPKDSARFVSEWFKRRLQA